jgi:hypothetical protein
MNNKYKNWYNSIITKAQNRKLNNYCEQHHILPRSLGGSDDPSNLVNLTSREHFICHALLCKMFVSGSPEWYKMHHAFIFMKCASTNQNRYFNSKLYEYYKKYQSHTMSIAQIGNSNSQFNSTWVTNFNINECRKIPKNDLLHWQKLGYVNCRVINFDRYYLQLKKSKENQIKSILKEKQQFDRIHSLYEDFIKSNLSLRQYAALNYNKSHVSLFKLFQKYNLRTNRLTAGCPAIGRYLNIPVSPGVKP